MSCISPLESSLNDRIKPTAYERFYRLPEVVCVIRELDQLLQLLRIVSDGDLISKEDRDELYEMGYCERTSSGFNIITPRGIEYLVSIRRLHC